MSEARDQPSAVTPLGYPGRLLAPGGRCFVTAFLMNRPAREALAGGKGAIAFDPSDATERVPATEVAPIGWNARVRSSTPWP